MKLTDTILQYVEAWLLAPQYLGWLWQGFLVTLWISLCTIILATSLGFLLAAARDSQLRLLRWPVMAYSSLFRNTPLLIQLFLVLRRRSAISLGDDAVA